MSKKNDKLEFYFFIYEMHEIIVSTYLADDMDIYEAICQTRFILSEITGLSQDRIRHIYSIVKKQTGEVKKKYISATNKRIQSIIEIIKKL
jgi:hypothetical protein